MALTREVADCYMLNWDGEFVGKLKIIGIEPLVYSRLKDDILVAIEALEKGTKYIKGKLINDAEKKIEDEQR